MHIDLELLYLQTIIVKFNVVRDLYYNCSTLLPKSHHAKNHQIYKYFSVCTSVVSNSLETVQNNMNYKQQAAFLIYLQPLDFGGINRRPL